MRPVKHWEHGKYAKNRWATIIEIGGLISRQTEIRAGAVEWVKK